VPDETTRRAFEETLADWRDEWHRASNPLEKMRVSTRGWLSLTRVVMATMRVGIVRPDTWRVFTMALVVAAGLSLLLIPSIWTYSRFPFSLGNYAMAILLLMPQGLVTLLAPASAIGFGAKPGQQPNVFAIGVAMLLTMVLLAGWVFPATNQTYREFTFAKFAQRSGTAFVAPQEGTTEQSAFELIRTVRNGWPNERRAALAALGNRLSLVISVPVFFVFGAAVRHRLAGRTRWGIARFVAGASAVGVFLLCSFTLSMLRDRWPLVANLSDSRGVSVWLSSLVLCLAIGVLSRRPRTQDEL